ncbi:MAG: hypothetical protein ACTSQH_00415 [Candidatus Hodarchaeales archaeon]
MKKRLLNFLLRYLFNAVTEDDILKYNKANKKFYKGKREITAASIMSLKSQAQSIIDMDAWNILLKDLKVVSNKRIYESSTSIDDIIFGKAMLFSLDVLEKKLISLSNLK